MSTVRELALKAALVKALADVVKEAGADVRKELQKGLDKTAEETDVRSLAVSVPGGRQVATISLKTKLADAVVTDSEALITWALAAMPEHVEERTRTIWNIAPDVLQDLLTAMTAAGAATWTHPETGETVTVPGIAITPESTTHAVTLRKNAGPELLEAYREGRLTGVSLPEILPTAPAVTS
ncbi:hypothetical protein [Streptomyces liangshanensis]|uniref:hypothetical protein n=1 Tax=Streptomyces liangshanensis TaxID=2717324 RepID=UPI0036DD5C97